MSNLVAVFTSAKSMAAFMAKAKACTFSNPVGGDSVFMVNLSIEDNSASDQVYSLADSFDGSIYNF